MLFAFSTLNRINRIDRRSLKMSTLEQLLIVTRDAPRWDQYEYDQVLSIYNSQRHTYAPSTPSKRTASQAAGKGDIFLFFFGLVLFLLAFVNYTEPQMSTQILL